MEQFGTERLRRLTPQDLQTFYPQALTLGLHFLLKWAKPDPAAAPLWKAMRYYLTTLRKRVADPGTDDVENFTMGIMLLRRMQIDGQSLFAVHVPTVKEPDSVLDQELRMDVLYDGDPQGLDVLPGADPLFALDQGQERYVVDRSAYEGATVGTAQRKPWLLMPRISVSMEDAVLSSLRAMTSTCGARASERRASRHKVPIANGARAPMLTRRSLPNFR